MRKCKTSFTSEANEQFNEGQELNGEQWQSVNLTESERGNFEEMPQAENVPVEG